MNGLPNLPRIDGTVPIENEVRKCMRTALKGTPVPRAEVAREMSEILGRKVTVSLLADFVRNGTKGRQVRFPLAWLPAFVKSTGDYSILLVVLPEDTNRTLELGECVSNMRGILEQLQVGLAKLKVKRPNKRARRN